MPTDFKKKTFKTLGSYILCAATIAGCGGGGGGDGEQSVPEVCRSYCSFACSRASSCGYLPAAQIGSCDNSCVNTIASTGGTAAACNQRGEQIAAASCSQLGSILGLRSLNTKAHLTPNQQEDSEAIAEHSGAELAISVTQ
jgi:hypothetical protein